MSMAAFKVNATIITVVLLGTIMFQASYARPLGCTLHHSSAPAASQPAGANLDLPGENNVTLKEQVIHKYPLPLVLNQLPKGFLPPSGPSKKINDYIH
ncbi:hypothetical protein Tsubulata_011639 [Turnera subulata]|uniref:Uncharacterized protein n=1 Tax=Turnera subulata TaxID=218843 RepID=A0A9Q0F1W0_9ROSI|nr:hypothetical protein Tsubulata_011639 [Turnera subulata]